MKIIDAYWEKRNLGLNSIEVHVDIGDTSESLDAALKSIKGDYIVVSLPVDRKDLYDLMLANGYTFIEAKVSLELDLIGFQFDRYNEDIKNELSCWINENGVKERVEREIKMGMYTSDRISLDPYFGKKDTMNRYMGFLSDELSKNAEILEFKYNNIPIGYSCIRKVDETTYYQSLVGMYALFRGKGLGFSFVYLQAKELLMRGVHKLITIVSSNNVASFRVHIENGFVPTKVEYIFVKHFN